MKGRLPFILSEGPSRGLRQIIVSDHSFQIVHGREQPTNPPSATPDSEKAVTSRAANLAKVLFEEESLSQDLQEIDRYLEQNNIRGWIIDITDEPPEVGIQDAQKLRIKFIHKNLSHRCISNTRTKGKSYELVGHITEEELELQELDFDGNKKVIRLAAFRNEWRSKLGDASKKPAAARFLTVERDWIYEPNQRLIEEVYQEKLKKAAGKEYLGLAIGQLGEDRRRGLGTQTRPWFDDHSNWSLRMSHAKKEKDYL